MHYALRTMTKSQETPNVYLNIYSKELTNNAI